MNTIGVNYESPKIYNYPGIDFNYLLLFRSFNLVSNLPIKSSIFFSQIPPGKLSQSSGTKLGE